MHYNESRKFYFIVLGRVPKKNPPIILENSLLRQNSLESGSLIKFFEQDWVSVITFEVTEN